MRVLPLAVCLAIAIQTAVFSSQTPAPTVLAKAPAGQKETASAAVRAAPVKTNIPFVDAKAILATLREDLVPPELGARTPAQRQSAWPAWVARRDAEIRARVTRGDEESVVNFLVFGTTFTKQPRVTNRNQEANVGAIVGARLDDLVAGLASPGGNERLRFARTLVERRGINPTTAAGKGRARRYLADLLRRVSTEVQNYTRASESLQQLADPLAWSRMASTFFRDRGLSSETSILPGFAIEQTLEAMKTQGVFGSLGVRRVAIVGPGLDFSDKEAGYDFYPPQAPQPFAIIDSLVRLGLAKPDDLRVTTFDLSPRVNQHLEAARVRARAGHPYILQLPRDRDDPWNKDLAEYWERFGDQIGSQATPATPPEGLGNLQTRAVAVRPPIVLSITPRDLNIVLQRLEPLAADQQWDLIIATSVLVYYDVFEQSLALTNLARMLRRGGLFLTNDLLLALPTTPLKRVGYTDVRHTDDKEDRVAWYQQQ